MTNKTNRYALVTTLAIFLSGCVAQHEPMPVEEVRPMPKQPAQPQQPVPVVPTVPNIPQQPGSIEHEGRAAQPTPRQRHHNQNRTMQPMIGKTLQADGVRAGGALLTDSVNNRANGSLDAGETAKILCNALANNSKFTLISAQQLVVAKQQLGLLSNGSLGTRSEAIGAARNVGAQYVPHSSASGNVNSSALQVQLILMQTGEII